MNAVITTDHWEVTECHRYDGTLMKKTAFLDSREYDWTQENKLDIAGRVAEAWAECKCELEDFSGLDDSYVKKIMVQPWGRSDLTDAVRIIVNVRLVARADYSGKFLERDWNEEA